VRRRCPGCARHLAWGGGRHVAGVAAWHGAAEQRDRASRPVASQGATGPLCPVFLDKLGAKLLKVGPIPASRPPFL
jgi:hypothetical protein